MVVCTRNTASMKLEWTPWSISLAMVFLSSTLISMPNVTGARAQASKAAVLANLRGQIQRYGCNLPRYATSVAGCRNLHARVKNLENGGTEPASVKKTSSNASRYSSSGYSSRRTPRPNPPSSSGGGFGALFGGGTASLSKRRKNYSTYGSSYGGYNGWSNKYPSYMRSYGRYRTLCVRTCDGYYYPVSFSTTRSGIRRDADVCQSSCQVPAKLFYHSNPGSDVVNMVDLQGRPYAQLENAFRYREEYVENCRCKPQPWSEAAKEVYEQRAEHADNPERLNELAKVTHVNGEPLRSAYGAGYSRSAARNGYYPQPVQRRSARPRYRTEDSVFTDKWSASSW
jgi:hypothetical protein